MSRTWTAAGFWFEYRAPNGEYQIGRCRTRREAQQEARRLRRAGLEARYVGRLRHRP
jgi:hypothetical protein